MDAFKAMEQFEKLVSEVKAAGSMELGNFFKIIDSRYMTAICSGEQVAIAHDSLRRIAEDLKNMVPGNGIMPSETVLQPDEDKKTVTCHVDAFIYDDCDVHDLVDSGKIPSNYCEKCGSLDVKPVEYISHSSSRQRAAFIFESLITEYLKGKTVLDLGSRFGAIMYGAYHFSAADKIIGIEMNPELCDIQRKIIAKHNLGNRIQVIQGNLLDHGDVINSSDVIVMNNVFEHFLSNEAQIKIWTFLREKIANPGTLLVSSPKLEVIFEKLKMKVDVSNWVEEIMLEDPLSAMYMADHSELGTLHLYKVK